MDTLRMNGIIVIDKPKNITSAKVVAYVKRALKADKVGHAGTLDPFARGVLICCVNQGTKLARFLLSGKKKYDAVLKLGEETDTQDFTGNVISTGNPKNLAQDTIQRVIKTYVGTIEQLPPIYSALKHKGVPLYKLARNGKPIQKPPRRVEIYNINVCRIDLPFIRFEVSCSAGTYIRTLCSDIGRSLGCGGHLKALTRTESSGFTLDQAISLNTLDALIDTGKLSERTITLSDALADIPEFMAKSSLAAKIRHGKIISLDDLMHSKGTNGDRTPSSLIKIVDHNKELIAVLSHTGTNQRLNYCCVLPKQDK
jgi:tRNA pseudouridine55 synthase